MAQGTYKQIVDALAQMWQLELSATAIGTDMGLKQVYGNEMPNVFNGLYPSGIHMPKRVKVSPGTAGNRVQTGKEDRTYLIEFHILLAPANADLMTVLPRMADLVDLVPDAVRKHRQLEAWGNGQPLVNSLKCLDGGRSSLPLGNLVHLTWVFQLEALVRRIVQNNP